MRTWGCGPAMLRHCSTASQLLAIGGWALGMIMGAGIMLRAWNYDRTHHHDEGQEGWHDETRRNDP